jgi:hypothetical protein
MICCRAAPGARSRAPSRRASARAPTRRRARARRYTRRLPSRLAQAAVRVLQGVPQRRLRGVALHGGLRVRLCRSVALLAAAFLPTLSARASPAGARQERRASSAPASLARARVCRNSGWTHAQGTWLQHFPSAPCQSFRLGSPLFFQPIQLIHPSAQPDHKRLPSEQHKKGSLRNSCYQRIHKNAAEQAYLYDVPSEPPAQRALARSRQPQRQASSTSRLSAKPRRTPSP